MVRFHVVPPENAQSFFFHSISPDGERLAFIAAAPDGSGRLYVRGVDSTSAEPLTAASLGVTPFWSPDSRSIAFVNGGKLLRIDSRGGPPQTICDAPGEYAQGTWSPGGVILFHTGLRRALYEVAATGGEAKPVLALDPSRQETSHSSPQFLPDGRHFLYFVQSGRTENRGIYIGSLDSKESGRLLNTDRNAVYAAPPSGPGHLLFMRGATLMAQPFDARRLLLTGEPTPVAEGIAAMQLADITPAAFSVSGNGVLAYRQGSNAGIGELVWLNRQGRRLGAVGEPAEYMSPTLSPDETRIAVSRINPQTGTGDLWLFDLTRGTSSPFTFDPGHESNPTWSPDSNWIAFSSTKKGPYDIYRKSASGVGEAEPLLESTENKFLDDGSRDGRVILFESAAAIWALPLAGDRKPTSALPIGFRAEISPNGRWVAYQSSESGRSEVYVQSFPSAGGKWQVSAAEATEPHWRRDGKELFYIAGKKLLAVAVEADGQVFRSGPPQPLFDVQVVQPGHRNRYQVAANGQRFLFNSPIVTVASPITVVTNWTAGLKR